MPKKDTKKFDEVVVSCDVGLRKPDIKIYRLILKRFGLKAKEVLFIDNQKWNLVPAKKLGMKVLLFKENKKTIKDIKKLGLIK